MFFEEQGFYVLRFTNGEIDNSFKSVREKINALVNERTKKQGYN